VVRLVVLSSLALAACWAPQYGNPGFYCHTDDDPACPDGQLCVGGRCVDKNAIPDGGNPGGHDMAMPPGGPHDFAMPGGPHDFAMKPQDFSQPPQDFATGPLCQCSVSCLLGCVGPDCCGEDELFGFCSADPTCTPS
jgi:hypothetical protein